MAKRPILILFVPAWNEEDYVERAVSRAMEVLQRQGIAFDCFEQGGNVGKHIVGCLLKDIDLFEDRNFFYGRNHVMISGRCGGLDSCQCPDRGFTDQSIIFR